MIGIRQNVAVLAMVALLLTAGCVGTLGTDDEDVDKEALVKGMEDVETYRFEMTQTMETEAMSMEVTATGAADAANEELYMEMDMGLGESMTSESYVVNGTQYTSFGDTWVRMELPGDQEWGQTENLEQQADLIADAELETNGTATVDGVETTVVEFELDGEQLEELLADFDEGMDEEMFDEELMDEMNVSYEEVSYALYVDESTDTVHKMEMDFVYAQMGQEISMTMEMRFYDHNEPVDIELPDEAKNATAFGADGMFGDEFDEAEYEDAFEDLGEEYEDEFEAYGEQYEDEYDE